MLLCVIKQIEPKSIFFKMCLDPGKNLQNLSARFYDAFRAFTVVYYQIIRYFKCNKNKIKTYRE